MRLLDARRFVKFAGDRGVRPGGGPRGGIERLWQVGWLAADLVVDGDPFDDLGALRNVSAVYLGGRLVDVARVTG